MTDAVTSASPRIAVILPCLNEAAAIGEVVRGFAAALPSARIHVFDNGSDDDTRAIAREAGAQVWTEPRRGKGHVVRRMFAEVDADVYVLADGDGTYDAAAAPDMVARLTGERLDMVTGARLPDGTDAYRPGHVFGNQMLTGAVRWLFGAELADMLSGYRVFSRRFVKSFPALSTGFEIETELTVHALQLNLPAAEIETCYSGRAEGASSKLSTLTDGARISLKILSLVRHERPLALFGAIAAVLLALAAILSPPLIATYLETGLVPRLPTAILIVGLIVAASVSATCGLILDSVAEARREAKRLAYLALT